MRSFARLTAVIRELRDNGPATITELAGHVDAPYDSLWNLVRVLQAEGLIVPTGFGPKRGAANAPILWGLAPANQPTVAIRQLRQRKPAPCSPPAA